jgi:mycothiol synthase
MTYMLDLPTQETLMDIRRFDPATIDDREMDAMYHFSRSIIAERSPEEPLPTPETFAARIRNVPPIADVTFWAVWNDAGKDVVARGSLIVPLMEGNEHVVQFEIMVLSDQRRKGIGTELLRIIADATHDVGRRLLVGGTESTLPAGSAFLRRVGAQAALEGQNNELRVENIDRSLMRSWIARAAQRAAGFQLGLWEGPYPEDRMDEIAKMLEAFNTVPLGDLDVHDFHLTPEQVRAMDETNASRGVNRWTFYVEEKATRTIAGFTEVFITSSQPEHVEQGLTAVFASYRNKGLGRWLKAAMVEKVLEDSPETKVIRTGNADVNQPMLNINREMGFRPASAHTIWQVPLDQVDAYLAERQM